MEHRAGDLISGCGSGPHVSGVRRSSVVIATPYWGARPSRALAKASRLRQLECKRLLRRDTATNAPDGRAPRNVRVFAFSFCRPYAILSCGNAIKTPRRPEDL